MGNGLSVSTIVDDLKALDPEERSDALDNLYEQHPEIKVYLKSKYHGDLELPQQSPEPPPKKKIKQPHLEAIFIRRVVPDEYKLTAEEYELWSKEVSTFWSPLSNSFIPNQISCKPIGFIYNATVQLGLQTHGDCLRGRYVALFWFDYFEARYPGREAAYDCEYVDLGHTILGFAGRSLLRLKSIESWDDLLCCRDNLLGSEIGIVRTYNNPYSRLAVAAVCVRQRV